MSKRPSLKPFVPDIVVTLTDYLIESGMLFLLFHILSIFNYIFYIFLIIFSIYFNHIVYLF
jgi:hypothetical protein